mgnify:CR=1 FL=1
MADDHGPGADVVDVFVAVDVGNGTALGPGDERRRAADAAVGTDRAIDAPGMRVCASAKAALDVSKEIIRRLLTL